MSKTAKKIKTIEPANPKHKIGMTAKNIVKGAGTVLEIAPRSRRDGASTKTTDRRKREAVTGGFKADSKAISKDWVAVGEYIGVAIKKGRRKDM